MFFGLFLGPLFAVLIFNLVIFVLVIRVLVKHSRRKVEKAADAKKYQQSFRTMISIGGVMFIFGLSWFFGAFTIAAASPAFQWLFVIFNTLQGFFLFIFFCVIGEDAREAWLDVFRIGKKDMKSTATPTSSYGKGKTTGAKETYETYMTSHRSPTHDESLDGKHAMELTSMSASDSFMLANVKNEAGETHLFVANGVIDETDYKAIDIVGPGMPGDLQVPPHIIMRLQGSHQILEIKQKFSTQDSLEKSNHLDEQDSMEKPNALEKQESQEMPDIHVHDHLDEMDSFHVDRDATHMTEVSESTYEPDEKECTNL